MVGLYDSNQIEMQRGKEVLSQTRPGIALNVKNFGQTPAHKVAYSVSIDVVETRLEQVIETPAVEDNSTRSVIGPGASLRSEIWLNRFLNEQDIADINRRVKSIYLSGRIEYVDVFNSKR
jgi:hypothetical protein